MHAELVHCVLDVAGWLKPHLWGSSFANDRHSVKYYSEAHEARYFIVECREFDANLVYGAADGAGTAPNCGEAHRRAREMHRTFLEAYHLTANEFPLLKLRPSNWEHPFVVAD